MDWYAYWAEEPWGAWRDNFHAGVIASASLNPHLKQWAKVSPEDFMLKTPEKRRADETSAAVDWLMAVAKKGTIQ